MKVSAKGFQALIEGFRNPDSDFRPATMWFWNDELLEGEVTFQLEGFKSQGIIDFFVNHVWDATDEYLSGRYFEVIRHTVREAKRLGLHFWIYDEFNWPSGIAGGKVIREHPETRAKILCATYRRLSPGNHLRDIYVEGQFESAQMIMDDAKNPEEKVIDVREELEIKQSDQGFYFSYHNRRCCEADLYIISVRLQSAVLSACVGGKFSQEDKGYVDALDDSAMRVFIDMTHEQYKIQIGEEFGKTVKGIFTDEVCVGSPFDLGSGRVPWNDNILRQFKERYGYDLAPCEYVLFRRPASALEKKVRYHYWRLVTELVRDSHIKQVYDWCTDNNLLYTGHFDGEESLRWDMYQSGDIFELMAYMHIPGIDSILSRDRIENEDFNIAGKTLSSCARFYNRPRTLCETYTISTNKLRFNEMRRIANRLIVLGVNMIQYMGSHYSFDNQRKNHYGGAPSFNYHNTLFPHLGRFGDYIARSQYLSWLTRPAGQVLVMCPQAGYYVNSDGFMQLFGASHLDPAAGKYDRAFMTTVNTLLDLNIEFDLFGDVLADKVQARDGEAVFFGGTYDSVIMMCPDDTTSAVFAMLNRLKAAGVKVILIDDLPQLAVDTGQVSAPYGRTPDRMGIFAIDESIDLLRCPDENKYRGHNAQYKSMLLDLLHRDHVTLDIRHDGSVMTGRRACDEAELVFVANDSFAEANVSWRYEPGMIVLNPDDGKMLDAVPGCGGRLEFVMEPCQLLIVLIPAKSEPVDLPLARNEKFCRTVPLEPICSFEPLGGNVLHANWSYAPFSGEPGQEAPPFDPLAMIPIPGFNTPCRYSAPGTRGMLVWDFKVGRIPDQLELFVESRDVRAIYLNNKRIDARLARCRFWGTHNSKANILDLLRTGDNLVQLIFDVQDFPGIYLVPFVLLQGDFSTDGQMISSSRSQLAAAPWNDQGYPQFSGSGTYRFTLDLDGSECGSQAAICVESHDVVELSVNGKPAGCRLWEPFRFDVTGMLKEGRNIFELTATSPLANLLDDPIPCGIRQAPVLLLE